jgi:hypothetical protein
MPSITMAHWQPACFTIRAVLISVRLFTLVTEGTLAGSFKTSVPALQPAKL